MLDERSLERREIDPSIMVLGHRHDLGDRFPPRQLVGMMLVGTDEHDRSITRRDAFAQPIPIVEVGGQPQLEDVAFELKPGDLSGIIQLGDKFVILKCEGRTQPVKVNPQEVQEILNQDIYEKKLRLAMNEKFEEIRTRSRIDNYLAGTSQSPERVKDSANATDKGRVDPAVRPTSGPPQQ